MEPTQRSGIASFGGAPAWRSARWSFAGVTFALVLGLASPGSAKQGCTTIRVSVSSIGTQGNGGAFVSDVSANGRFVFFSSGANNLVPGDTNGVQDAFVHDRDPDANGIYDEGNGVLSRISVSSAGVQGNGTSGAPRGSADGRYVAFYSFATNLVPGDTNSYPDIFLHDRVTAQITRVHVDSNGNQANGPAGALDISADGRHVAFSSGATNLVGGDHNGSLDIFLHDRANGATSRVSVSSQGVEGNNHSWWVSLSAEGRFIGFVSEASNLVLGDTNGTMDVFVHDRVLGTTILASVDSSGNQANGLSESVAISGDGNWICFGSYADNLTPGDGNGDADVFLRDLQSGTTTLVSAKYQSSNSANNTSAWPTISADGRFIAFESAASDLVPGNGLGWDIFVRDRLLSTTMLYSVDSNGVHGNGQSLGAKISLDGVHVAFSSQATNLVPGDTNNQEDAFVRSCQPAQPTAYCLAKPNSLGCTPGIASSGNPSASAGSGFSITALRVVGQKAGLLFYSRQNSAWLSFQGGYLCIAPPLRRTTVQVAGGSSGMCNGAYALDFNAWIQSGQDPTLGAGEQVWAQYWSRDPGYPPPQDTGLTNALTFVVGA